MAERRRGVRGLLAPIEDAHARRLVLAGVAGLLITAPLSLQQAIAPRPVVGWLLTLIGAALAVACARGSWCPPGALARAAAAACLVFCAVTLVLGIHQTVAAMGLTDRQLICADDIASETVGAGREIVAGVNPYSSFDVLTYERSVGCAPLTVTPVRSGLFASASREPGPQAASAAAAETLSGHPTGGLVTIFDYPAGTALLGVVGAHGLVLLALLALLLAGGVAVAGAEPRTRRALALALGAQTGVLAVVGVSHPDAVVAALLVVACARPRSVAGGVALGLACAVKQTAWFVAVPLLLLAWRQGGRWRGRFAIATAVAFAAVNLPLAIASLPVWTKAVLTPLTQPAFPLGLGPAAALTGGAYSTAALAVFSGLMVVAVASGILWCARMPRSWAAAGVIVASLGLWIGMRSLGYYIALLGVIAVATVAGARQLDAGDDPMQAPVNVMPEASTPQARGAAA
jgi:hypothetical protein